MTLITDLPDEILDLICRNFLSKSLTEHGYLCDWETEWDAWFHRRVLCSLSRTCKALSKIALPVLYEQLFDDGDLWRFIKSAPRPQTIAQRMPSVRYLTISSFKIPELQSQLYWTSLRLYLMHCVRLRHLGITFNGSSHRFSTILAGLAELRACKELDSLHLRLYTSDSEHTIFKDVSKFTSLKGLEVNVSGCSASSWYPHRHLEHLRELVVDGMHTAAETPACLALTSPDILRLLHLRQSGDDFPGPIRTLDYFNTKIWQNLRKVSVESQSPFVSEVSHERSVVRFPALREISIGLQPNTHPAQLFGIPPIRLIHLHIDRIGGPVQLLEIIALIKDARWSSGDLESIDLEFERNFGAWNLVEDSGLDSLLERAAEATQAAESHKLVLKPVNLVRAIQNLMAYVEGHDSDSSE